MDRRQFLGYAAWAAGAFAACSPIAHGASQRKVDGTSRGKRVIVVGAGLAGLVAADELTRAGHDVMIFEARGRAGGRVYTIREPFADGLHAEAGAMFIPDSHRLTLEYVRRFHLPIEPSTPFLAVRLFYVRGRRIVPTADTVWPFDLTAEERRLGIVGMWKKYVGAVVDALGDATTPGWPADRSLQKYDDMSMAGFLRTQGASEGAVALLRLGYLDLFGDGIESYSALYILRDLAGRTNEKQRFSIRAGNDQLARAFANGLEGRIYYGTPVVQLEPGDRSAGVVIRRGREYERRRADHVICTLPFSVLKGLDVAPSFSARKRHVIEQLPYTSVTRIHLQARRRVWNDENPYVSTTMDLPFKWAFDHTVNQPGRRGILGADAVGPDARHIAQMVDRDRITFAVKTLEQIHRGLEQELEHGTSTCWDDDPWARGAFSYFKPGQIHGLLPAIASAEGRIHFAGEHASSSPGWMQGALESGLRAAREVAAS